MTRLAVAAALPVFAALALTACGSGQAQAPSGTVTVTETVTVAAPPAPSSSAAANGTTAPNPLGQTVANSAGSNVTVHAYDDAVTSPAGQLPSNPATHWVGIDVEVCVASAGTVSPDPWSISDSNHGTYGSLAQSERFNLKSPMYPLSAQPVAAGQCTRGWITYTVPKDARIVLARYSRGSDVINWATS